MAKKKTADFEPLHLLEDEPVPDFKTDELGLLPTAKVIAGAAAGTRGPFTIGVFGDWGHGKTSVLRQAMSLLDEAGGERVTVWFNAWQFEREDHPIVPLAATIVQAVEDKLKEAEGLGDTAKGWLTNIERGIRAIAYGFSATAKVGVPGFGEVEAGFVAKEMIDRYEQLKAPDDPLIARTLYYNAFETLKEAAGSADAGGEADGPKIVVFIDDLDRCLPPQGIKLLESIKLVLAQPGFVFVLAVDRRILEAYLTKRYEQDFGLGEYAVGGTQYLDKIVQLPLGLRPHRSEFKKYIARLLKRPVFQEEGNKDVREAVAQLVDVLAIGSNYNPRNLVRFINNLIVDRAIWLGTEPDEEVDTDLLGLCAVGRILRQHLRESLYQFLVGNRGLCDELAAGRKGMPSLRTKWLPEAEGAEADYEHRMARDVIRRLEGAGFLQELMETDAGKRWLRDHKKRNDVNEFLRSRPEPEEAQAKSEMRFHWPPIVRTAVMDAGDDTEVKSLDLVRSDITDLEPLCRFANLQALDLTNTKVTDIGPLARLSNLRTLILNSVPVVDLEPLEKLARLERLYLHDTQVANLKPLLGLKDLRALYVGSTLVRDLEALRGLLNLRRLHVGGAKVANLEPIKGLWRLRWLNMSGAQVTDLEPLRQLANLQVLDISGTHVADLEPLKALSSLGELHLTATEVSDEQVEALKKALPDCEFYR